MELLTGIQTIDPSALELGAWEICLRLACAMVIGLIIGIEREYTHRPAGMRTHILVALGACAVMITGQLIFTQYLPFGSSPDPARLSAQVISGVGFLGAGTIMREGANVKGLTTAASLWAVACLGIAAGGGYYTVALAGTVFVFATLTIFELLQKVLLNPHSHSRDYCAETDDVSAFLQIIQEQARLAKCEIRNIQADHLAADNYRVSFQADFGRGRIKERRQQFFSNLVKHPATRSIRVADEAVGAK
ncbi:MAG: MgtC/SapB family protein [Oscillospiraceae bacterium]|nr:MgtC/SapB family protein [Oscillospiraceae bacterium]